MTEPWPGSTVLPQSLLVPRVESTKVKEMRLGDSSMPALGMKVENLWTAQLSVVLFEQFRSLKNGATKASEAIERKVSACML